MSRAALAETQRRAKVLGILAGTLPATGPGVVVAITDPQGKVRANVVLTVVQELRDAGAEALQIEGGGGARRRAGRGHRHHAATPAPRTVRCSARG